jgi:hypothetical protein
MKIILNKMGMTRSCQEQDLELLQAAGWAVAARPAAKELSAEPLVLKPPVKAKSTAKTLDNANQQGDE